MDNFGNKIGKILGAVQEAQGLLNEFITPEIEAQMTPEQREKLEECRKATGEDLEKHSEILKNINLKHKRHA